MVACFDLLASKGAALRSCIAGAVVVVMLGACASDPTTAQRAWGDVAVSAHDAPAAVRLQLAATDSATDSEEDLWFDSENDAGAEEWDPLEGVNRFLFAINEMLDVVIFRPLAVTYSFWLPVEVQDAVRDATRNIRGPVIFLNDLFQGSWERAETTGTRFLINSTIGIGGLLDPATDWGYEYHDEDFGQTLGVWGAGPGPYLVLPIFGPSSARDGTGRLVDILINPFTYVLPQAASLGIAGARGIDARARFLETGDELKRDSVDFYARIRSLYLQSRENDIRNGEIDEGVPAPGLSDEGGEQTSQLDDRVE